MSDKEICALRETLIWIIGRALAVEYITTLVVGDDRLDTIHDIATDVKNDALEAFRRLTEGGDGA